MKIFLDKDSNILDIVPEQGREIPFAIRKGSNGKNYVVKETVADCFLNVSEGNSKTGEKVVNLNFPIEYTCDHRCECYKEGLCYAESGCYLFACN